MENLAQEKSEKVIKKFTKLTDQICEKVETLKMEQLDLFLEKLLLKDSFK